MYSEGMYVSCPIYVNDNIVYVLGKISSYDEENKEVAVVFFDRAKRNEYLNIISENRKIYFDYEISRVEILCPAEAIFKGVKVNIICEIKTSKNAHKSYCCKYLENGQNHITRVSEADLEIDFVHIKNSAKQEAIKFNLCEYEVFFTRRYLSKRRSYINSFETILATLVNTRVFLYPHQIDTVIKATRDDNTRVMLADEVGLGKTIEALTILKFHLHKNLKFKSIIVVPSSLEYQWINELNERFKVNAEIFSYNKVIYKKSKGPVYVISYADFNRYRYELEDMKWDMMIIHEPHKILNSTYYNAILKASKKIKNVVLLSATPIVHDGIEYLRLVKLLNPQKYRNIKLDEFKTLINLQATVRDKLFDMNSDISFYEQMDMSDAFITNLEDLNKTLQDEYLAKIIASINGEDEDCGLYSVKLAMEYLRQKYIVEADVIRHRRVDIKEANIQRNLRDSIGYEMCGSDIYVYESNTYDAVLQMISNSINSENKYKWIRILEAMHSSPYALISCLSDLDNSIEGRHEVFECAKRWKDYCDKEIAELSKGKDTYNTRFGALLEKINPCEAKKILIFSEFRETVGAISLILSQRFGEHSVARFDIGMSRLETQLAARKFQNEDNCRFIVCDKSGGEGRNFQKADLIIHFDMSWSPAMMEQRIGRLDRIGRDVNRDVDSIVIYAANTVEENIFNIYQESLRVFTRSLCGLEIIFEQLQEMIANAFVSDVMFGLTHVKEEIESLVSQMEENVERELYFTSSNESDARELAYMREVSEAFENEAENEAEEMILDWLGKMGVPVSSDENRQNVDIYFRDANMNIIQKNLFIDVLGLDNYSGTFRRDYAVKHDTIDYFSTEHSLYKVIMTSLDRRQSGRFTALALADYEDVNWAGFVFTWRIEFDEQSLLRGGLNPERHQYIRKYLNEQQVVNVFRLYGDEEHDENEISVLLQKKNFQYINSVENTVGYGDLYDEDSWEHSVKNALIIAQREAKQTAHSWLKNRELKDLLQREDINQEISAHTVHSIEKKRIEREKCIMSALLGCKAEIDSILYIEL